MYLVVPSTSQQHTVTFGEPTYLSAVTCGGSLIHAADNTCLTSETAAAAAADGDHTADDDDDGDDNTESPETSSTVRPPTLSAACARQSFNT